MGRGKHIKKPATDHEEMINEFIPEAERYADYCIADWFKDPSKERNLWSRIFLDRMNDLTIAAGLRVPFGKEEANG